MRDDTSLSEKKTEAASVNSGCSVGGSGFRLRFDFMLLSRFPRARPLLLLIRLHPLVKPFAADQFSAAHCDVRQFRNTGDFAGEHMGDVRL